MNASLGSRALRIVSALSLLGGAAFACGGSTAVDDPSPTGGPGPGGGAGGTDSGDDGSPTGRSDAEAGSARALDVAAVTTIAWSEGVCGAAAERSCAETRSVKIDLAAGTWSTSSCAWNDGGADEAGADGGARGDVVTTTRPLETSERQTLTAALSLVRVATEDYTGFDGRVSDVVIQEGQATAKHEAACSPRQRSVFVAGFAELRTALGFASPL